MFTSRSYSGSASLSVLFMSSLWASAFTRSSCPPSICPSRKPRPKLGYLGDLYAESGQTLQGSFSAVSKPNFASKYSLELAICSKALAEIYTMQSLAPFWNRIPKNEENHEGEKSLVQSREKWPGEAHRQLQLSTQCYPRARTRIKAV